MGLDMYLYSVNRKVNSQEELDKVLKLRRFQSEEMDAYKQFLDDGSKEDYVRAVFMPDFCEKYLEGDEEAVATFEKNLAEVKVAYDIQEAEGTIDVKDLGYWRKHADLHGYFHNLYKDRGGEHEFNCQALYLSKTDCVGVIDYANGMLRRLLAGEDIEHTTGFFFGASEPEDWTNTIVIFQKAIDTVDFDNESVYYDSWW
jgi:hypothetical protein